MKKILLLSDTHSYMDDKILQYCKNADEVWHAGDIGSNIVTDKIRQVSKLRAVYGNIDDKTIRAEFPLDNIFTIEKVPVWITHIGGYPYRYDQRIREMITKNPPKLFISGHSHILKVQYDKKLNLLHLNPGSAGKYGIHKVRTMLRFMIENKEIKNLEVIEMENRF
ncbi:MAG: YfcE family phosphodiesterase [Bacteroidetes bacterium]|nr:MAG: YfcE family phosphodiesterase [Bacteroidota bacterium]